MTLPLYATPFVDDVSVVPAAFLNDYVRTQIPKAVDGVGGGVITPATVIEIQGTEGLKLNGTGDALRLQYGAETLTRTQTAPHKGAGASTTADTISVVAGGSATQMLDRIPDGSRLTSVTIYHDRVNAGTLPTTRVTGAVRKRVLTTGNGSVIGPATEDPTATLGPYEAYHGFDVAVTPETVNNATTIYWVELNGEVGGVTSPTTMYHCTATFEVTSQDKAP